MAAGLGLVVVASVLPALPARAAEEVVTLPASGSWSVEGRGWGHGIGMSQWGAQGAALQGLTAEQILDFYYPGTTRFDIGQDYALRVRLSALGGASATFGPVTGSSLVVVDTASGQSVTAAPGARIVVAKTAAGFTATAVLGGVQTPLTLGSATTVTGPVDVRDVAGGQAWAYQASGAGVRYPATLRSNATGTASLEVVAHVPMEQYLRGVVPRESSSGWAPAALQAQAVAARSYALAVRAGSGTADLCDTTACQVYGGAASSTAAGAVTELYASTTDAAVLATARIARYYGGGPAFTQFSSTNGGYSKVGSRPYLVAKPDPYSGTAPGDTRTRWTDTLTVARVQQSCPAGGTLQRMVLTRDGLGDLGGRILSARLECTTGTATIATPAFGLLSSWWRPTSVGVPRGNLEVAVGTVGGVRVKGWALDPDTTDPVTVRVTYGGQTRSTVARLERADVGAAFPGSGSLHGFDETFPASAGPVSVCVTVVNVGSGTDLSLGCASVTVSAGAPFGSFDSVAAAPGSGSPGATVAAQGWAVDPDAPTAPVSVQLLVDGVLTATATGNLPRPDVGAALPGVGDSHGYRLTATAAAGQREICVRAVDTPSGSAVTLGCRTVTVPGGPPRGNAEVIVGDTGGVRVVGWALDPDTTDPVSVRVDVAGTSRTVRADGTRNDIAGAFPGYGSAHGFSAVLPVAAGTHVACVTALDSTGGAGVALGCATVTVAGGAPRGNVEVVAGRPGGVQVSGWALDPDTTGPIYLWADVDGASGPLLASGRRADVGAAFPALGADHGFSAMLAAASGQRTVCLTALDDGAGPHTELGCWRVTVPGGSPVGNLEVAKGTPGGVQLTGWALDPDSTSSPYLWVELDGRGQYMLASGERGDIAAAFPGYGSRFGFSGTVVAQPGSRTVCVTIVNGGVGAHTSLGCRTVVVPAG